MREGTAENIEDLETGVQASGPGVGIRIPQKTPTCAPAPSCWAFHGPAKKHDAFGQRPLRGQGSLCATELFVNEAYRDDVRRQIFVLTDREMPAGTGRARNVGFSRRAAFRQTMFRVVDILAQCASEQADDSLRLRNTLAFSWTHLLALLGAVGRKKLKRSTVHNLLSVLRRFMTLVGRRHLVPGTDELALVAIEHDLGLEFGARSYVAHTPRCWSAFVDVEAVLSAVLAISPHAYLLCQLCLQFGLRLSEVLRLRPVESDLGDTLWISRGTKGGRERFVRLSDDPARRAEQRSLVEQAKLACACDPSRHLGFGDRNLQQARKYFESVMQQCGVTETQLGIVVHGLRHEYAIRRFLELTGMPAPVLRQAPLSLYMERMQAVRTAREQIAEELGHGRTSVVSVYIGSLSTLRHEAAQANAAAQLIGEHQADLQRLGVASVTVVVCKTAATEFACELYVQRSLRAPICDEALIAQLSTHASRWLRQDLRVLAQLAPARAGTATVRVN